MDDRIFIILTIEDYEFDYFNEIIEETISYLNEKVEEETELKWNGDYFDHQHMQVTYEWEYGYLIFSFHYTTADISNEEDENLEEQTKLFKECLKTCFHKVLKVRGTFSNGEKILEKI